jgi:hypothetical protein
MASVKATWRQSHLVPAGTRKVTPCTGDCGRRMREAALIALAITSQVISA